MMHVTCATCGLVVPMSNVDYSNVPLCKCVQAQFTSNVTISAADWNKALRDVRSWKVTLYGPMNKPKQPVPDVFQDAFKDGELEL